MPTKPKIRIALASCNGAEFIAEQIESIGRQWFTNWRLFIRDDGSSDETLTIVKSIAASDSRLTVIEDDLGSLGSARNFGVLMQWALDNEATYLVFSDQDDVWKENKIARQIEIMLETEQNRGVTIPTLVHSDLAVADEKMEIIHQSFMRYQRIHHETTFPLDALLTQNFVTGCATMINQPLLRLAMPLADKTIMHDCWLALLAAAAGETTYIPEPLVNYRQHDKNIIGAKGFWASLNPVKMNFLERWRTGSRHTQATFLQAERLAARLQKKLPDPHDEAMRKISVYSGLQALSRPARIMAVKRLGVKRQDTFRRWLLWLRLLVMSGKRESKM